MVRPILTTKSVFIKKAQELGDVVNTSPEFDNAVCILENHITSLEKFYVTSMDNVKLYYEGAKAFTLTKRCHGLWKKPNSAHWATTSCTNYLNLENIIIVVRKHGARYLKNKVYIHNRIVYKVWSFEIFKKENGDESLYGTFVWCERGLRSIESNQILTENIQKSTSKFSAIRNLKNLNQIVRELSNTPLVRDLINTQFVNDTVDNKIDDNNKYIKCSNIDKEEGNLLKSINQTDTTQPIFYDMAIENLFEYQYVNILSNLFDNDWYDQCQKIDWAAVRSY